MDLFVTKHSMTTCGIHRINLINNNCYKCGNEQLCKTLLPMIVQLCTVCKNQIQEDHTYCSSCFCCSLCGLFSRFPGLCNWCNNIFNSKIMKFVCKKQIYWLARFLINPTLEGVSSETWCDGRVAVIILEYLGLR